MLGMENSPKFDYQPIRKFEIPLFSQWLERYANQRGGGGDFTENLRLVASDIRDMHNEDFSTVDVNKAMQFFEVLASALFPADVFVFREDRIGAPIEISVSRNGMSIGGFIVSLRHVLRFGDERGLRQFHNWAKGIAV